MTAPLAGRYLLGARLGAGGVAEVLRARDVETGEDVAVKWLLPQVASDRTVRRRFLREAAVMQSLAHPNVLPIVGAGEAEGRPYLVLPLAQGGDLRAWLDARGPLGWPGARPLLRALAGALAHAHGRGVVHRDLKPQNVLLARAAPARDAEDVRLAEDVLDAEDVRLADFGLARAATLASLTGSTLLWGSPAYMAPELLGRGRADPRSDLYSLGVLAFEAITGRLPWPDENPLARLAAARGAAPPPPSVGDPALDRLLGALLAPDPAGRPASAADVLAALDADPAATPALATAAACGRCGAPRPADLPVCLGCGARALEVRHTPGGPWRLVLVSLKDDAATMERLHGLLVGLTGSDRLHLKFLVGDERFYTAEERRAAIRLPVVLFADLDEASARTLEAAFVAGGLDVVASRRLSGRQILRRPRPELIPTFAMAGMVVVDAAVRMHGTAMWVVFGAGALMATGVAAVPMGAARTLRKSRPRFRLADRGASIPESDALLAAAVDAARRLAAPEVRALFAQTAAALYRLARRAEGEGAPGARRLLDAAAPLVPRIAALADRLDALDRALGDGTDGELARALAQLERRLAVAPPADRPALEATRSDLEAALDRRAAAEDERARLATWLCALLSGLEDFARRGLALDDRIEAEALEAATRELEAALAPAEPDSARRA